MSTSVETSPPESWGPSDDGSLLGEEPEAEGNAEGNKSTYSQILRSSAIIGGSSVLNLAIGMVRSKAMAVMLGPAGFGLMGAFTTIADLARSVAEMGINASGVRQIAESVGSGDLRRIARTVTVLRRTALVLGFLGAALVVVCARRITEFTFGNTEHTWAVALLSLAVLFRLVADGQGALLQGMRRIGDMAKSSVFATLCGTIASIVFVYFLRERGVALSLVAIAAISLVFSWWYSRRVEIDHPPLAFREITGEASSLLRLGFAFMASGVLMMSATYLVRIILIRHAGLAEAGHYQAAWALGGMYVGFVLEAMGADFYPRLVAVAYDPPQCNRIVNEQAQVSLLLAAAGVIGTLTFAPFVVRIFYSAEFQPAAETLRWICLGMALRVVTWPIGYIIVARNERLLFCLVELAWASVNVALSWICIRTFGLRGAGIAFFASYVFHTILLYPIARKLTGFTWNSRTRELGLKLLSPIAITFASFFLLPPIWATSCSALIFMVTSIATIRYLNNLIPADQLPPTFTKLRRLLKALRTPA
jgi:enterobacterial common antigen flippase